ncbi:4-hydroxy-tetrahydrodipicolinate synthase [Catenibacterium mitsuokai]|uniref:4-hydroxy-tetrahydrodipicolinate synthase n=1 Tax=Catenibacterium mitsuokai TaxID=100886 RepID=UPI001C01849E|nr:4-hydroxy-tetrahydrodipicolinate synthase [Catenibacterium mitsuokai]MBT9814872.1 4-hydroxy-tetrahydrodipicolinate synthase [Catenibacterium mitsuokai]
MEPIFEGTGVALVLPMFEDGSIDYEGYKRQVQRMIDGGVKALLVNGTTGEPATIDIEDEFELTKITVEMAKGTGVKVIVGAGSNYTAQAIRKAKFNAEAGADANLVVTPYYNKTSQRGLIEHYKAVAAASDLPLIMYNVPGRTGMKISVDTVVELAKVPNIVAMKDATDDIAYAMEVLTRTKDMDFDLYSGCDDNILPFIAAGGKGVISVLSNLYPRETEMFTQAALKGDLELARKMAYDLNDVSKYLFIDVNPIMPKAALKHMGVIESDMLRQPLIPTTEENKKLLFDAMKEFESKGY